MGLGTGLFGATVAWNSVESIATATHAAPLGATAGMFFKLGTQQQVTAGDGVLALTGMIPLPPKLQIVGDVVFDAFANWVGQLGEAGCE
jgi:hypothetical protein